MNYYELQVTTIPADEGEYDPEPSPFSDKPEKRDKRFYKSFCREINEQLDMNCERKTAVYAYYATGEAIKFIYEADIDEIRKGRIRKEIGKILKSRMEIKSFTTGKPKEITGEHFYKVGRQAYRSDYVERFDDDDFGAFYNSHNPFSVKEAMIPEKAATRDQMIKTAGEYLADDSFIDEIERIYSDENKKEYFGNPVHYLINVSSSDSIKDVVSVLAGSLYANRRILGRRITYVSDIDEGCYDEEDFEKVIARSDGNIVVLELSGTYEDHGSYANAYHRVIEYIDNMFRKYQRRTLCVFVKNVEHPGFADVLIGKITDSAKIVGLKEGGGDVENAMNYIKRLASEDGQPVDETELKEQLSGKNYFSAGEVREIYNKCFSHALMYDIYRAYKTCSYVKNEDNKTSGPYEELQNMIGLTEIKKVVDSVINNARIQKIRSEKGMDTYKSSLHMVYTGNPGSAKTTVARLLARILARENIIDKGEITECGRADLVGRYVGWTAKQVTSKFRQASGGILFIDEAYSLVDDSHSFGDEAINTIVQEMENHRDDVIVIFAGYPDKMKEFLDKNEGLRSRIAFHLDFPDYDTGELIRILEYMAKQKGYTLEDGVTDMCREIFDNASSHKDFGNGRFVRNLLEQAMIAQSDRLYGEFKGRKISRKALNTLKPDDFNVNAGRQYAEKKQMIGF